jgi:hypothetical protein
MTRALLAIAAVLIPAIAAAQDTPKVGVTMAAPSAIGVLWNIADRFAVRPEITWSHNSGESTPTDLSGVPALTSDDSSAVGVALGALFYVGPAGASAKTEGLRTYVVPRVSYTRSSTFATINNNSILGPTSSESKSSTWQTSLSFGGQYTFGRHFGVFGEAGFAYARLNSAASTTFTSTVTTIANGAITQTSRIQTTGSSSRSNTVGTRTAVGVILLF